MFKLFSFLKDLLSDTAIEILTMVISKYIFKTKQIFKPTKHVREDKIKRWEEQLKKLKQSKKNKLKHALLKEKINHLSFRMDVGYDWPKEKRDLFNIIWYTARKNLILPKVKFLFGNIKVSNGIIHIKMSLLTKFDIVCHFTMALLMLFIGPLLLFLSSQITRNVKIGQPLFWIFAVVAIMILVYNLYEGFKKPLFLKRMKQELEGVHIC